jgi:integrase
MAPKEIRKLLSQYPYPDGDTVLNTLLLHSLRRIPRFRRRKPPMKLPLVSRDPAAAALARLDQAPMPQYLVREQVAALAAACSTRHHGRDRLLVRVAFETGGRVSELVGIRRSDVDLTNRQIRLKTLKRRSDRRRKIQQATRWLPVSHSLVADLGVYLLALPHTDEDFRLFPLSRQGVYKLIRLAGERAGLVARGGREVSPHILRHSYAMNCITQGVPITVLKDLLGHASIGSTMVYLKTDPAQAREFLSKVQF